MQYSVSRLDNIYLGVGTIGTFGLADNCPVAATCYAPHTAEVASLPLCLLFAREENTVTSWRQNI